MTALDKIHRAILRKTPGSAANIAMKKRAYERQLRAQGHSRAEALRLAAEHFRNRG